MCDSGKVSLVIALAWVMFTRLDGHAYWVNAAQCNTVQGAPAGYNRGTLLHCGSDHMIVSENVNQVIRKLRGEDNPKINP